MSFSLLLAAGLSTLGAKPLDPLPPSKSAPPILVQTERASYERVAKVLIGEKICRVFGYSIDVYGLADWANNQTAVLAEQSDQDDLAVAQRRMTRTILSEFRLVRDRYWGGFELASAGRYYNSRRFQMRYRKKCDALANSPDAGAFFEKTGEEQDYLAMVANVRNNFMRISIPGPDRPGRRTPIDVRIPRN